MAKLGVVAEEADECVFWFEYLLSVSRSAATEVTALEDESKQLARIFKAAAATARGHSTPSSDRRRA